MDELLSFKGIILSFYCSKKKEGNRVSFLELEIILCKYCIYGEGNCRNF